MKRGYLGSAEVNTYEYWSGGKSSHELKCNETILYSEIDLCQSYAQYAKSEQELQIHYSKMDEMYMCLKAVEMCGSDDDLLRCAGAVIGNMKSQGCFSINFASIEEENKYIDKLVEDLKQALSAGGDVDVTNPEFDKWFEEDVVAYNYYQTPSGKMKERPQLLGATSTGNDDYTSKVKDGALAFLYHGANEENVFAGCRNEDEMTAKIFVQGKTKAWFASSGTNMTQKSINNAINSGIVDKTGGLSQEEAIDALRNECVEGGLNGTGLGWVQIVMAIATAISVTISLVAMIVKFVQENKSSAEYDYDEECPYDGFYSPSDDDYVERAKKTINEMLDDSEGLSQNELFAVLGIAGVGIIGSIALMMNGKKKREHE